MYRCTSPSCLSADPSLYSPERKGAAPPFISSSPPTLSLSFSLAAFYDIFNDDVTGIIRDAGRRGNQVRANAERTQRAPAVIFLKDLSTRGGGGGAEGSLCAAKGFLARKGGRKAALPPLENPSSLFCANSSTLGRGSPLEELADA